MADNKAKTKAVGVNQTWKRRSEAREQGLEKSEVIDLQAKTTLYSTDKDKHHVTGSEILVHPKNVERLVEAGLATREKPKAADKDKK